MAESDCSISGSPLRHVASMIPCGILKQELVPAEGGTGVGTCKAQQQDESQGIVRAVI